eukprot:jgi/Undpi1/1244/HiC_scaffold_108.g14158.m1
MEFPGATEDPESISFIDPVWLQQWGLGPENALDYFALSPFYDKACNNEQCRMQGVDPREGLLNLTGLEFMLEDLPEEMSFLPPGQPAPVGPQPRRLFVIKKQMRKSRTSVEVRAIYYIMEGVIYQTPTVQKLIKSRLNKFTHHLNNAFVELSKLAELNDSAGGYDWAWQKDAKALKEKLEAAGAAEATAEDGDAKAALKLSMDNILMGLVGKYIDGDGDGARGVKRKAVVSAATTISSSGSTSTRTSSPAVGAKGGSAAQAKSEPPGAVAMGSKPAASAEPTKLVR